MFKTPLYLCSLSLMANLLFIFRHPASAWGEFRCVRLVLFWLVFEKESKIMFNVFKPQTFFSPFHFLTKTFCVHQTCSWNSTFAQVDFCFPKVQLLPHFLCWEPFARMSLRSGRSKMTHKKTKRESFVNCSNNSNANIFLPSLAEDAMPPTESGLADYAFLLFSSAPKSLVIVHIKCHRD